MAIGTYLFLALVVFLLSKGILGRKADWTAYSATAVPLILAGLILLATVSNLSGVMIFAPGRPTSYSIPDDYLALGIVGWAAMAIAVIGILSPVVAALMSRRRDSVQV